MKICEACQKTEEKFNELKSEFKEMYENNFNVDGGEKTALGRIRHMFNEATECDCNLHFMLRSLLAEHFFAIETLCGMSMVSKRHDVARFMFKRALVYAEMVKDSMEIESNKEHGGSDGKSNGAEAINA